MTEASSASSPPARKTSAKKLKARRDYYAKKRTSETKEEAEARKARHRQAAARYRQSNKIALRIAAWQRRQDIKVQKKRQRDQEEYDAWMNEFEGYTDEQRDEIDEGYTDEQREKDKAEIDEWMDEEYPDQD
ncbi:hypothetical protein CVT24_010517 [Panaeolus cyanescens]|uniref:BZIP domain-containing protein n=1 Tax=Panaeolus cyanescens TaxID=181874 RepID=A0A409WDL7_9AGAR|nr:hypothetical protein CVT24_010517 [Panaeolus cyanescens]